MLNIGKLLVEAIAAANKPLKSRREVEKEKMRFDVIMHDPHALFNFIAN